MAQILLQLFHTIFHLTDFLREADEFLVMVENIFLQCRLRIILPSELRAKGIQLSSVLADVSSSCNDRPFLS